MFRYSVLTLRICSFQDDDSDLDVELDPVPTVSAAVAESISSFVKVRCNCGDKLFI